jgi:hypothetical protein
MQGFWIAVFAAAVVSIVLLAIRSRRRSGGRDLGVISDQWMAQHRAKSHERHR